MEHILRDSREVGLPAQAGLVVRHSLAQLAIGTRSLLEKSEATEQLAFQPIDSSHASPFPAVDDHPPDFTAKRLDEQTWEVGVYASSRFRHPLSTTSLIMCHVLYAVPASSLEPIVVKSMRRDLYTISQADERYRPGSYRLNQTGQVVLKAIVPAVQSLHKLYDLNPDDWVVE